VGGEIVGLFENGREANLASVATMVEDALIEEGMFINDCRLEIPGAREAWSLQRGNKEITLQLLARADAWVLRATGEVVSLPPDTDRESVYERLLTLNTLTLTRVAFALEGASVSCVADEPTETLCRRGISALIDRVYRVCHEWGDRLVVQGLAPSGTGEIVLGPDDYIEI